MNPLWALVITSAMDRGHSRASFHHFGFGVDLAVAKFNGTDVVFAPGTNVQCLHPSLWFGIALARNALATFLSGPIAERDVIDKLAGYLRRATGGAGVEWIAYRDHVHGEYHPKQPRINDPAAIRAAIEEAAAHSDVDADVLKQIGDALIALRHVRG